LFSKIAYTIFCYLVDMSVKTAVPERDGLYFITFTCQAWLALFGLTNSYDVIEV